MKKILILTVIMGIGMVFLSQDAKAQVANNSNVNTPITATVGVNIPTTQTQNGTVSVEGGGTVFVVANPPTPPPPPIIVLTGVTLFARSVVAPPTPAFPVGVSIVKVSGVASLPGGTRVMFDGDHPGVY